MRPKALQGLLESLPEEAGARWFKEYLDSRIFTPDELAELEQLSASDPRLQAVYQDYLTKLSRQNKPLRSTHPVLFALAVLFMLSRTSIQKKPAAEICASILLAPDMPGILSLLTLPLCAFPNHSFT